MMNLRVRGWMLQVRACGSALSPGLMASVTATMTAKSATNGNACAWMRRGHSLLHADSGGQGGGGDGVDERVGWGGDGVDERVGWGGDGVDERVGWGGDGVDERVALVWELRVMKEMGPGRSQVASIDGIMRVSSHIHIPLDTTTRCLSPVYTLFSSMTKCDCLMTCWELLAP